MILSPERRHLRNTVKSMPPIPVTKIPALKRRKEWGLTPRSLMKLTDGL